MPYTRRKGQIASAPLNETIMLTVHVYVATLYQTQSVHTGHTHIHTYDVISLQSRPVSSSGVRFRAMEVLMSTGGMRVFA